MASPPNLADVAQDYCEFHVNVEARNPSEHTAPQSLGARLMKKLSTSVDLRRIMSSGERASEEEKSQLLRSTPSSNPKVESSTSVHKRGSSSKSGNDTLIKNGVKGDSSMQVKQLGSVSIETERATVDLKIEDITGHPGPISDKKLFKESEDNTRWRGGGFSLRSSVGSSGKEPRLVKKLSRPIKKFTGYGKQTTEKLLLESSPLSQCSAGSQKTQQEDLQTRNIFSNRKYSSGYNQVSREFNNPNLRKKSSG